MTTRPGSNLIRASGALVGFSLLGVIWPSLAWAIGFAALCLALAAFYDRKQASVAIDSIDVARAMPQVVGRDVTFDIRLQVSNRHSTSTAVEIRDEYPPDAVPRLGFRHAVVNSATSVELTSACRILRRGRRTFGPVWVRLAGPWRLVEVQKSLNCPAQVKVFPETFASRERLQKDLGAELKLLDKLRSSRQHGAGAEFDSLYQFRLGDDPRRIDWRASARQRELVVRRFQIERHRDVMIIIDSGRLMGADSGAGTKLDCAVDAALNLARVALLGGDRCGVAAYDREVRGFLPPVGGATALKSVVECIFGLETQWHESEFTSMLAELRTRRSKRTFLVILSDVNDAETSQRLCASLRQLQRRHLVLFAALRTPLLNEIVKQPVHSLNDAAKKAVVFRLLRDRSRALHELHRGGIHVLDVEPNKLTAPLVNQFIELRQRNLL